MGCPRINCLQCEGQINISRQLPTCDSWETKEIQFTCYYFSFITIIWLDYTGRTDPLWTKLSKCCRHTDKPY